MATLTFQKILTNLSANKNVKNLVSELEKVSKDLKTQGAKLNTRLQSHTQYKKLVAIAAQSQKEWDRELNKALKSIKGSASNVEKNLQNYKRKAMAQSKKLEKMLKGGPARTTKKTAARKTTKKTTRKKA
jgi:hypothetical protein